MLYVSIHQGPRFYPYAAQLNESQCVGVGTGTGFTVNIPFPEPYGDNEMLAAFYKVTMVCGAEY